MKTVYLGLGSNIGDRAGWICNALAKLEAKDLRVRRSSSLYETEPVGLKEQAWFVNLVAECETELFPLQLLRRVQRVELALGRRRTIPNGPRTIDIDILLYGNSVIQSGDLQVPHPRLRERRFVLEPLAELNPELREPISGVTMRELLRKVTGQTVRKIPAL